MSPWRAAGVFMAVLTLGLAVVLAVLGWWVASIL